MLYLNIRSLDFIAEHLSDKAATGGRVITNPDNIFNVKWCDNWINSDFGRRIITEIDHKNIMLSDDPRADLAYKYRMAPQQLCTGTKNCLLAKFYTKDADRIFMTLMGPNCFKFLLEAADTKDIKATLDYFAVLSESDIAGRQIYFEDLNKSCDNLREYADCLHECDNMGLFDYTLD